MTSGATVGRTGRDRGPRPATASGPRPRRLDRPSGPPGGGRRPTGPARLAGPRPGDPCDRGPIRGGPTGRRPAAAAAAAAAARRARRGRGARRRSPAGRGGVRRPPPGHRLLVVPQRRAALEKLVLHATNLRIPIVEVEGGSLTALAGFDGHQGVALVVEPRRFAEPGRHPGPRAERGEPPFVLVLDSLEDPHNVGSLLRSAEAAGVHGVIFPTQRQAPLSPSAVKASAGAVEHLLLVPGRRPARGARATCTAAGCASPAPTATRR